MDAVYSKFVSSIDTVFAAGVVKTPLVFTSAYTRIKTIPAMVDLNELKGEMRLKEAYTEQYVPVSYLLEGKFTSMYANQAAPAAAPSRAVVKSGASKVLVFGDADIIKSELHPKTKKPEPIDFDRNRGQVLSNKDFLLQGFAYLIEEEGIINARKKRVTLRPLDPIRAQEEKTYWQTVNIALPIACVAAFGFGYRYWRKRKYGA
jgi:gliding-associated putative ABC transporter substrate-binding component GldG